MKRLPFRNRRSGSTLLLALWALLLLSAAVLAWAKFVDAGIAVAFEGNQDLEARALAHSGLAVGLNPSVTRFSDTVLDASFGENRSYHVEIQGEGGKLNLNNLLNGEDPVKLQVLKDYLEKLRGLNLKEREILVDCMLDWVDADNQRHPNGMEDQNGYHPANKPFKSLDDVEQVHGMGPLLATSTWKNDLTVTSERGKLDLLTAPAELLALIPGIDIRRAERFVKARQEKEARAEKEGAKNDREFQTLEEALSYLGFTSDEFKKIDSLLGFKDTYFRIRSTGKVGEVERQVEVIVEKPSNGRPPNIIEWIQK